MNDLAYYLLEYITSQTFKDDESAFCGLKHPGVCNAVVSNMKKAITPGDIFFSLHLKGCSK